MVFWKVKGCRLCFVSETFENVNPEIFSEILYTLDVLISPNWSNFQKTSPTFKNFDIKRGISLLWTSFWSLNLPGKKWIETPWRWVIIPWAKLQGRELSREGTAIWDLRVVLFPVNGAGRSQKHPGRCPLKWKYPAQISTLLIVPKKP